MAHAEQMPDASNDPVSTPKEIETLMQIRLAGDLIPGDDPSAKLMEWGADKEDSYSDRFRKYIDGHPDVLEHYQEDPEGTLEEIKKEISH